MSLVIPRYLEVSGVQDPSIRYPWDDWNMEPAEEPLDKELVRRLAGLSQRAILAFAAGSAEWLVFRFLRLEADRSPWEFLEAAWAMMVHTRYSGYGQSTGWAEFAAPDADDGETVPARWSGPVRGPISRALTVLESTIQELAWHGAEQPYEYTQYAARWATRIHNLTLHVLQERSGPYRTWVEQALQRLVALYPRVADDALGDVVPRAALDPDAPFDPTQAPALIAAFLAGADRANPFLSDAQAMLEPIEDDVDFIGIPYAYSLELDRAARQGRHVGHRH